MGTDSENEDLSIEKEEEGMGNFLFSNYLQISLLVSNEFYRVN